MIEISFTLACKDDDEEDEDVEPVQKIALQFVRTIGLIFPKKKSYPVYKNYIEKMFESSDIKVIKGAFHILGNLAEGVPNFFKRDLENIIMKNYISNGIEHSDYGVRKATCYAINHFAQYLHPEFIEYHE